MKTLGRHYLVDLWQCNEKINCPATIERALVEAVQASGVTLIDLKIHCFSPQGITAFALLSESHISIHTWPEYGYAGIDIFTCGETADPDAAVEVFKKYFQPEKIDLKKMKRGRLPSFVPNRELLPT